MRQAFGNAHDNKMSTKVQPISEMEDTIQSASVSSTTSPKVSLFAKKSGFVIPKNKLSGSLVPIFRNSKKPGGADVVTAESNKQVLRKTKWGPDLTQDSFVKKGRTSAYQTRLDQIMQQLKSLEPEDDHDSPRDSLDHNEKSELELEKREVIGEILKLNPSYKAPADYKPLLKQDKVAMPIKEHPERNFIGLIYGPAGDTQKRLEKETGAKIRVYGTKADTKEEIEITLSDENKSNGDYEELFVTVTAETYEKVDTAVSLIELLITPVIANTKDVVSGDNDPNVSVSLTTMSPPVIVTEHAPRLAHAQPYPNPIPNPNPNQWLTSGQPSRFIAPPFPRTGPLGSVPSHPHTVHVPNVSYAGPPRNHAPPLQVIPPGQPSSFTLTVQNQNIRPMGPTGGWSQPPAGTRGPNVQQMMQQPMVRPGGQPSLFRVAPPQPPSSVRPPPSITALRPPSSNDFTFQTHRPQPPTSQFMPPQNPPPSSFRPVMNQNHHGPPPPMMQGLHRPHNSQQMGQHQGPPNNLAPLDRQSVFPRQFGPGSFPPRPGNFGQVSQNHSPMGFQPRNFLGHSNQQFRGNVFSSVGRPSQQIYDPFSPSASGVPRRPNNNAQNLRKHNDDDSEYDDLMASVGVK